MAGTLPKLSTRHEAPRRPLPLRATQTRKAGQPEFRLSGYAIVPRTSLTEMVDQRAREIALKALGRVSHSMALEDQQVDRDLEKRIQTYVETALRDRDLWETT